MLQSMGHKVTHSGVTEQQKSFPHLVLQIVECLLHEKPYVSFFFCNTFVPG